MINTENKYTELLEDYTELKQTNEACEQEYRRLTEKYNKMKKAVDEIKVFCLMKPLTKWNVDKIFDILKTIK